LTDDKGALGYLHRRPVRSATPVNAFEAVTAEVEARCLRESIYMLGAEKARFLRQLIRREEPALVVECGTAIGYSGLHIADGLRKNGRGRLITVEIDGHRAGEARNYFERAGLEDLVEIRIGDAARVLEELEEVVDFLFLDNSFSNYYPCFLAIESRLAEAAVVAADNVGIGGQAMDDYLSLVRSRYESTTHWFETDLPWAPRDAMEVTRFRAGKSHSPKHQ
jgi:predicted O-methyltransferase YrrM